MYFQSVFHSKNRRLFAIAIVGILLLIGSIFLVSTLGNGKESSSTTTPSKHEADRSTSGEIQNTASSPVVKGEGSLNTGPDDKNTTTTAARPTQPAPGPAPSASPVMSATTTPAPQPYVSPNSKIHVTKTGSRSISWTSNPSASGFYITYKLQGACDAIGIYIPCSTDLTKPGTTFGSHTFDYAPDKTFGETVLVVVCTGEFNGNCGVSTSNYAYLDI